MAVEAYIPALTTVITTALIDSINPCAIGVLILLVSVLMVYKSKRYAVLRHGLHFLRIPYLSSCILGILCFLSKVPLFISEYISIIVGSVVVIAGLIEIKDFFWYYVKGITLSIPPEKAKKSTR